jgi:hypothetical protein
MLFLNMVGLTVALACRGNPPATSATLGHFRRSLPSRRRPGSRLIPGFRFFYRASSDALHPGGRIYPQLHPGCHILSTITFGLSQSAHNYIRVVTFCPQLHPGCHILPAITLGLSHSARNYIRVVIICPQLHPGCRIQHRMRRDRGKGGQ